jgi:hypothetical protein
MMKCEIAEKDEPIMQINLSVESKQLLDIMMYNFDKSPEVVYKGLIAILTGEVDYLLD